MDVKEKSKTTQKPKIFKKKPLENIKNTVTDLNSNLLELQLDRRSYSNELKNCKVICSELKELIDATTRRITNKWESFFNRTNS